MKTITGNRHMTCGLNKEQMVIPAVLRTLIRWSQTSWDKPHTYEELAKAVGYKSPRMGRVLDIADKTLRKLEKKTGKRIPVLGGLIFSKGSNLPSYGYGYVVPGYDKLPNDEKAKVAQQFNKEACAYDWSWVMDELYLR